MKESAQAAGDDELGRKTRQRRGRQGLFGLTAVEGGLSERIVVPAGFEVDGALPVDEAHYDRACVLSVRVFLFDDTDHAGTWCPWAINPPTHSSWC